MRSHEFISENQLLSEFGFTDESPKINLSPEKLLAGERVGHLEGKVIRKLSQDNIDMIYIFTDQLETYVTIDALPSNGYHRLYRLWNDKNGIKGILTMLVIFIIVELKKKLVIDQTEDLTNDSKNWLINLLKANGRGLKITNNHGKTPTIAEIQSEWDADRLNWEKGDTALFFENRSIKLSKEPVSELLMPMHRFLKDDRFV